MSNITAKIIADSISNIGGKRITTFELEYPRFIHAEFMTHRMISKNAASSRAIPVASAIKNVHDNTAIPVHWGKNQAGMQANEECINSILTYTDSDGVDYFESRESAWRDAMEDAASWAYRFSEAGYHKQIVNRLTEPFQMIKVVATATEWDNFFWLRKHPEAQPEIRVLAEKMWEALQESIPEVLKHGEWHTPYVAHWHHRDGSVLYAIESGEYKIDNGDEVPIWKYLTKEEALKVSSSMCAQVSYRKADDTLEKALMVYDRLVESKPVHASPFEHQATPMPDSREWEDAYERVELCNTPKGVTAIHKTLGFMSGNLAGWVQHRQLIENNTNWNYKE